MARSTICRTVLRPALKMMTANWELTQKNLLAAALAGCFNMKLSFVLNEANFNPEELSTEAVLNFVDGEVTSIDLKLHAKVPGITQRKLY